jgi:hypothetical protein
MTDETTAEQLAEIEGQGESTPVTEYTPPEGWRVVRFGEQLLPGDMWVHQDGTEQRSAILHWDASAVSGGRCIRRIKPQPEPQPTTDDPSGPGWRDVEPDELLRYGDLFWNVDHWQATQHAGQPAVDERTYRRRIEPQPEPQPNAAAIEELRSEVAYVQRLLGTERQRVTQLDELVGSLRTINEAQEKAFEAAGKENTALRNQLAAVKAELASVAADRQRLRVELDAAQQVPADSPELRQLRADLAEVTQDRDTYKHARELLLADANAGHARTKAMTVEAIVEWLEPVRATIEAADNVQQTMRADNLACDIIRNLPGILRYVVGLDSPEDVE